MSESRQQRESLATGPTAGTPAADVAGARLAPPHIPLRSTAEAPWGGGSAQLRLAVEVLQAGFWSWDVPANRWQWSPQLKRTLGYAADDLEALTYEGWRELIHPQDRPGVLDAFQRFLQGMSSHFEREYRLRHRDGSHRWMLDQAEAQRDATGRVLRVDGAAIDVHERRRAEQALRESEERFEMAVRATDVGIWDYDLRDGTAYWSPRLKQILGYDESEPVGGLEAWRDRLHPDDLKLVAAAAEPFFQGRVPTYETECRIRRRDGAFLWIAVRGVSVRDEQGRVQRVVGSMADITLRRVGEEQLRRRNEAETILAAVSMQFVNLPCSEIDHAIDRALQSVGEFFDVDRSYVFLLADDGATMSNVYEWCADGVPSVIESLQDLPLDEFPWIMGRLRGMQTVRIASLDDLPPAARRERAEFEREQIRSLINVPLCHSGGLIGFVGFDSVRQTRHWSNDEIRSLRILSSVLANALQRRRSEELLRQSEQRFRLAFEEGPLGTCIVAPDLGYLQVNRAYAEMLGYQPEELVGRNVRELTHPDDFPILWKQGLQMLRHERAATVADARYRRRDGQYLWVRITATAVRDRQGRMLYGLGMIQDITQQKEAERLLQVQKELAAALSAVSDLTVALNICLGMALAASGMDSGAIYLVDERGGLELRAQQGLSEAALRQARYFPPQSPPAELVRGGRPAFALQPAVDGPAGDGIARMVAHVPVLHEGRPIASLHISTASTGEIPLPARTALEAIAAQVGTALVRLQAEQALQRSEARLRTLVENLPDFVLIVEADGTVLFLNRGGPEVSAVDAVGRKVFEFVREEYADVLAAALRTALCEDRPQNLQVQSFDGRWYESRLVPLSEPGEPRRGLLIGTDITQRRKADEQLRVEQQLLRQLLELHERDRKMIAYEIHDGLAQDLAGTLFHLQAYAEMADKDASPSRELLDMTVRLLSTSIAEARRLISGLRPPVLDESGVVVAVEYLVGEAQERGCPPVSFLVDVQFDRLAFPLENAIFRIVQEALNNACRYSESPRIELRLTQVVGRVQISVEDWGRGFRPDDVAENRFGLRGIRERARLLGGSAEVHSAPGAGARIFVDLPLIEAAHDEVE